MVLPRYDFHPDEDGKVVEQRRDDSGNHHLEIAHSQVVGDDERRRAHDGRHKLPSRGGSGLYGASNVGMVARFLHQGNRERTGERHIGHCGTRDRSDDAGADHRSVGGASLQHPPCRLPDFKQQSGHADDLHESAEYQEQKYEIGGNTEKIAENPFEANPQDRDDKIEVESTVGQMTPRDVLPEQEVRDESTGYQRQYHAPCLAGPFDDHNDEHDANDDVPEIGESNRLLQVRVAYLDVGGYHDAAHQQEQHDGPCPPSFGVFQRMKEHKHECEAKMKIVVLECSLEAVLGDKKLIERHRTSDNDYCHIQEFRDLLVPGHYITSTGRGGSPCPLRVYFYVILES